MNDNNLTQKGAWLIAGSAVLFATLGAEVRFLSQSLSNEKIVFFRNALGLVALVPFLLQDGFRGLRTDFLKSHIVRSMAGLSAMYCSFYALAHLPLADAIVLGYTAPLFMPMIARFWLGEPIPEHGYLVLAMGFLGVLFMVKPGFGVFKPASLIGLLSGVLAAVAQVSIRGLTRTEPVVRIVFYFALVATFLSFLPLAWRWQTPPVSMWGWLMVLGVIATTAQLLLTHGYRLAPPARVGVWMYVTVIWSALLDYVLWKRRPDMVSVLGAILVCVAGGLLVRQSSLPVRPAP